MKKILITEDDETLARMYKKKLEVGGYTVVVAYDGEEGVKMAKSEKPDLMLLDIMMPRLDGFGVVKELKSKTETKDIPIIILTNLGTSDMFIDEAKILGVEAYLVKYKTSSTEVLEKVKEILGE